ncbi:hypothetical protein CB1_001244016 [Camelus ferus]|nr:hypothetical protein CB1_001244016 [Camelus ferus]
MKFLQVLPNLTNTDYTTLSFSCTYPLVVNVSQTHPYPVVSFLYITIYFPGTGDTIVILSIFTDPQLSSPLENRPAPLGKPLYVVLRATSSDPDRFALVANVVFASSCLQDSCPVSNRLLWGLRANGASLEVTLAFNLFRFSTSSTCTAE